MADRNGRIRIFEETIDLCRRDPVLRSAISDSVEKQRIVWEEDPLAAGEKRYDAPASLVITPERTFGAARKYLESGKRICALNFASSVTPGGGVVWARERRRRAFAGSARCTRRSATGKRRAPFTTNTGR